MAFLEPGVTLDLPESSNSRETRPHACPAPRTDLVRRTSGTTVALLPSILRDAHKDAAG